MVENSIGIITAICPYVGYERAAEVAKEALKSDRSVKELVLEKGLMDQEQLNKVMDPYHMTEPGIPGKDPMEAFRKG